MCVCTYECGGQKSILGVIPESTWAGWPKSPGIHLSLPLALELQAYSHTQLFTSLLRPESSPPSLLHHQLGSCLPSSSSVSLSKPPNWEHHQIRKKKNEQSLKTTLKIYTYMYISPSQAAFLPCQTFREDGQTVRSFPLCGLEDKLISPSTAKISTTSNVTTESSTRWCGARLSPPLPSFKAPAYLQDCSRRSANTQCGCRAITVWFVCICWGLLNFTSEAFLIH